MCVAFLSHYNIVHIQHDAIYSSCSYVWGAVSDKKGRKPVVIISCLLIGVFSAAFGFSVELYMAIIFRFMTGLFNGEKHTLTCNMLAKLVSCSILGVVGTVKAIVSESSNNRTQALGMTLIMCSFSLGLIIGPAVSGALADPIGQYNLTISSEYSKSLQHHCGDYVGYNLLQIQPCEDF